MYSGVNPSNFQNIQNPNYGTKPQNYGKQFGNANLQHLNNQNISNNQR